MGPVWLPWGCGQSPGPRVAAVGKWPSPGPRVVAVGAGPVAWVQCGRRGSVAGPLGPVGPPWGCG